LVDSVADFEQYRNQAKLVMWGSRLPEQLQSVSFQGPQLRLPTADDKVLIEISAAMVAMAD
jgi:hypothetical protein